MHWERQREESVETEGHEGDWRKKGKQEYGRKAVVYMLKREKQVEKDDTVK